MCVLNFFICRCALFLVSWQDVGLCNIYLLHVQYDSLKIEVKHSSFQFISMRFKCALNSFIEINGNSKCLIVAGFCCGMLFANGFLWN